MEIKTITRKWGNSIAVVIPKDIVESERIREDQEVTITVETRKPISAPLFGKFPRSSKETPQEIKDEVKKGWESRSDRKRWR